MIKKLCLAIKSRTIIRFTYKGMFYCMVEPLGYGVDRDGKDILKGYQIAGSSDDNTAVGLKYFKVEDISDLKKTGRKFKITYDIESPADEKIKWIC
jgi:hypothetical protein